MLLQLEPCKDLEEVNLALVRTVSGVCVDAGTQRGAVNMWNVLGLACVGQAGAGLYGPGERGKVPVKTVSTALPFPCSARCSLEWLAETTGALSFSRSRAVAVPARPDHWFTVGFQRKSR